MKNNAEHLRATFNTQIVAFSSVTLIGQGLSHKIKRKQMHIAKTWHSSHVIIKTLKKNFFINKAIIPPPPKKKFFYKNNSVYSSQKDNKNSKNKKQNMWL